mgnify:FL=1
MINALYRGKRIDNGEWAQGWLKPYQNGGYDDIKEYPRLCIQNGSLSKDIYEVIPETVGQWTGLTDKNGIKVFDGDIVKDDNLDTILLCDTRKSKRTGIAIVKYGLHDVPSDDPFCWGKALGFYFDGDTLYPTPAMYEESDEFFFEIIGNFYDNADLLE